MYASDEMRVGDAFLLLKSIPHVGEAGEVIVVIEVEMSEMSDSRTPERNRHVTLTFVSCCGIDSVGFPSHGSFDSWLATRSTLIA